MSSSILAQTPQGKAGFTPQGSLVVKSVANSTLQHQPQQHLSQQHQGQQLQSILNSIQDTQRQKYLSI